MPSIRRDRRVDNPRLYGESGAQFQILKGVLFEGGGGKRIQPFREKEVKFDDARLFAAMRVPRLSLCGAPGWLRAGLHHGQTVRPAGFLS